MRASFHVNVIVIFEILIPIAFPIAFIFIGKSNSVSSNEAVLVFIVQVAGLYILGRFVGRKIPASCNNCFSKVTPKGTSLIVYNCDKCGYKYAKRINSTEYYHDENNL